MKRLYKVVNIGEANEQTYDFGFLPDKDIALVTRGYKFDKENGVYTRKGSNNGFYVIVY